MFRPIVTNDSRPCGGMAFNAGHNYTLQTFLQIYFTVNIGPILYYRAVVSGGAGGTLAPLEFGSSVNPIPTRGGIICPPHYC